MNSSMKRLTQSLAGSAKWPVQGGLRPNASSPPLSPPPLSTWPVRAVAEALPLLLSVVEPGPSRLGPLVVACERDPGQSHRMVSVNEISSSLTVELLSLIHSSLMDMLGNTFGNKNDMTGIQNAKCGMLLSHRTPTPTYIPSPVSGTRGRHQLLFGSSTLCIYLATGQLSLWHLLETYLHSCPSQCRSRWSAERNVPSPSAP